MKNSSFDYHEFVLSGYSVIIPVQQKVDKSSYLFKPNKNVFRCSFTVVTSDGCLQHIEIGRDPNTSIHSSSTLHNGLTLKGQLKSNVFCVDYHPELCLLVAVSSCNSSTLTSGAPLFLFLLLSVYTHVAFDS